MMEAERERRACERGERAYWGGVKRDSPADEEAHTEGIHSPSGAARREGKAGKNRPRSHLGCFFIKASVIREYASWNLHSCLHLCFYLLPSG